MINSNNQKPVILVIAGHDPSGGAGIQADIESIANAGCHATTVITSLTAQNTNQVIDILPQEPESFRKQIRLILEDMEIAACKIGMIGNVELVNVIQSELSEITFPIVLDPIINATSGQSFADENVCKRILSSLLPLTTLITPNSEEARMLSQSTDLSDAANKLLDYGTKAVLITGTDEDTDNVINSFYTKNNAVIDYQWERLTGTFHGSGCTLSSRITALLALGNDLKTAVEDAQAYTWNTLKHGLKLGRGQAQPDRFYEE
jgi:hydroxymethylpyrimidine/phosphomethylpyrimidine kinase